MSKLPSPGGASGKNGMRTRNAVMVAFTLPVFLLYIFFFIVVMFLGVYYSMTNWTGISQTFDFIGLRNYATVLSDERFWQAIWFNIRYAIMLDIGVILISLLIALALNNLKGKTSTLFRSIFFIPAVLSLVTVGLIWNELFLRAFPPIGEALGIEWLSKSILGSPATAIFGILIVNLWQGCATPTVLLLAGLQSVPSDLYEAATIDGAGKWRQFFSITVPMITPIIFYNLVTQICQAFQEFNGPFIITNGGPRGSTTLISILVYNYAFKSNQMGMASALAWIMFVIVCILTIIAFTSQKKWVYYSDER